MAQHTPHLPALSLLPGNPQGDARPITATPLLITYAEAAELLGRVSVRHIERLIAARKLRAVGSGRARRVVYASLLAYIEGKEGQHG